MEKIEIKIGWRSVGLFFALLAMAVFSARAAWLLAGKLLA